MNIEKLKEALESLDTDCIYGESQEQGRVAVDVISLRLVIDALFAEIARQSVKSEEVQEAIEWQVSLKDYHQNKWKKAEPEWQEEPGSQSQHNKMMKALDLAIAALQAYEPKEPCSECIKYQNDFNYCADCGRKLGD